MKMTFNPLHFFLLMGLCLSLQLKAQTFEEIDTVQLAKLINFADSTFADEIMLIHKGKMVNHWKSGKCDSLYFGTASMSKSWTGLVIGIMIEKGLITSEDERVCNYLPEWEAGCKNGVTIKNLLNMTAGFNRRGPRGILSAEDANHYAVHSLPDTLPNVRFGYSNVSVQLLGMVIEKVTGKNCNQYFSEVLFEPLGMDSTYLRKDRAQKNFLVYGGAKTTLQDAAQVGLLMKNKGILNGRRIVPESWVQKSTTPSEFAAFYGYLWWIDTVSEDKNYAATGDLGQMTIIFPDLDLIFLRRQTCNTTKFSKMEWMGPPFVKLVASVANKK